MRRRPMLLGGALSVALSVGCADEPAGGAAPPLDAITDVFDAAAVGADVGLDGAPRADVGGLVDGADSAARPADTGARGADVPDATTADDASDTGGDGAQSPADATTDTAQDADPAVPDAVPDAAPDAAPDAVPDAAPDAAPDAVPDAAPDAVTDATTAPDASDAGVDATAPDVTTAPVDGSADAAPDGSDPYVGLVQVYNTSCHVTGAPTPPPPLAVEKVLGGLSVTKPVQLVPAPDGGPRVYLVSQPGLVLEAPALTPDGGGTTWLDIQDRVEDGPNEAGLLSLAFHPSYATNGWVFVDYTRAKGAGLETVVSRFTVQDPVAGAPDPASEVVILTVAQPYANHNGGQIAFGPDGMLYIGMGDGGSGGDPQGNGQNLGTLLGAMLRIDVSAPDGGYAVPLDNPFVGVAGARGEIWAYGLRNPWRFSFDPVSGALWVGDVGQNVVEEIDVVVKGGNYGWNIMEGNQCYQPSAGCSGLGLELPVAWYDHTEGKSVTGGHVYRGAAIPTLYGTTLYADFSFGTVWGLSPGAGGAWQVTKLADTSLYVSALAAGPDGESYVLDWGGGVYRLVPQDPGALGEPGWPANLTETGCFADVPSATLADGILHYTVNSPLWSDGATKDRALVLPPNGQIGFTAQGAWDLPLGTVLIKTFSLGKRLETRFLVRGDEGWRGATYRWNEAQTEAWLLEGAATEDLGPQTWSYPSRGDCTGCHTAAAGGSLGLSTGQMNAVHDMLGGGVEHSQIGLLAALGYFEESPPPEDELVAFPAPGDGGADLAARARALLHANCAHCHVPGGLANATLDLRFETPLDATGACGVDPQQGDLGVSGAKIIAPGHPELSTLLLRMGTLDGASRMPPIASSVVDEEGVALIEAWIAALEGCSP